MKCPKCDKEPYKVFKLPDFQSDISLKQRLLGYKKCVHCGTTVKKKFKKPFWVISTIFAISYIFLMLIMWGLLFDISVLPAWFFMGSFIYILGLFIAMAYSSVLSVEFIEIDERE